MKNLRWLMVVFGAIFLVICCLGATPQNDVAADERTTPLTETRDTDEREPAVNQEWENEEPFDEDYEEEFNEEFDDEDEEDFDIEREIHWEMAEQSLLAQTIELTTDVAMDEVKTAVVSATLLVEHSELTSAIDALAKAIQKSSSPAVKRALRLKLAEAHLENDDPTSAIVIAKQLMIGE